MAEATQARNRAAGKIAALDTPQVCPPDAAATALRFVSPNAVPAANPVKIGQAIDLEIAERLSNAFPQHGLDRLKVMKGRRGKRVVVFEIDVGDGL